MTAPVVSKSVSDHESNLSASAHQHTLFVSYARDDADWVEGYLLDALHSAQIDVHTEEAWFFVSFRYGDEKPAILRSCEGGIIMIF